MKRTVKTAVVVLVVTASIFGSIHLLTTISMRAHTVEMKLALRDLRENIEEALDGAPETPLP